jgi:hypothetical protein
MGLYPANCSSCGEGFQWFSGTDHQLCLKCSGAFGQGDPAPFVTYEEGVLYPTVHHNTGVGGATSSIRLTDAGPIQLVTPKESLVEVKTRDGEYTILNLDHVAFFSAIYDSNDIMLLNVHLKETRLTLDKESSDRIKSLVKYRIGA